MEQRFKSLVFTAVLAIAVLSGCGNSHEENHSAEPIVYLDAPYYLSMISDLKIYTLGHLSTLDSTDTDEVSSVIQELERYHADIDLLLTEIDDLPSSTPEAEEYTATFKELLTEANDYAETAISNAKNGSTYVPDGEKMSSLLSQLNDQLSDFSYEEQ